jgi:hypothetical protein
MKRWRVAVAAVVVVVVVLGGVAVWVSYIESLNAYVKHETNRWVVIQDVNGDKMAVEPVSDLVWQTLVRLNQNGTEMFVGGIVERYDNKWGFRFKRDSVTVAQVTAEGLQGTISYISENLDYWLNSWAYVSSKVVEMHES